MKKRCKKAMGMRAFTLAGADARQIGNKKRLFAFTLAETLITLMIIGVVAVLVIPAFVTNVKDQTLNGQRKTANMKLLEGFRQMRVDGKLMEKYNSTEAFVNEMQKYFKINGVCKNDNLAGCFPSSFSFFNTTINDAGKEEYGETTVKTLDDIKDIKSINSKAYADYDNFMGINFADGVNMLIAYKKDCVGPEDGNTNVGKKDMGELATCFAYFYDINATQSPNIKGKDIISNVAFAEESIYVVNGNGTPTPMTKSECETFVTEHPELVAPLSPENACIDFTDWGADVDYWIGAVAACEEQGMRLPTQNELSKIASDLKCLSSSCPKPTESPYKEMWEASPAGNNFSLWSNVNDEGLGAYTWIFADTMSYFYGDIRNNESPMAICVPK